MGPRCKWCECRTLGDNYCAGCGKATIRMEANRIGHAVALWGAMAAAAQKAVEWTTGTARIDCDYVWEAIEGPQPPWHGGRR
jgi:hypothetical protein